MTQWLRLWHDMPTDPKWRVVARKSGQPVVAVIAVFNLMMVCASSASRRGMLEGWNDEDAAACLDMDEAEVAAIREAMEGKVLDGGRMTGWEKRQPKREDGSAERAAAWRERQQTQIDTEGTQANAGERIETPRTEKRREDTEQERLPNASHSRAGAEPPAPAARTVDEAFKRFWAVYPKRDGANPRKPASAKFAARARSGVDPEAMIAAARQYATELAAKGRIGTVYVAQAVTWLNQDRFGDYAAPPPASTGPPASSKPLHAGKPSDEELLAKYSRPTNATLPSNRAINPEPAVFQDGGGIHRPDEGGRLGPVHRNPSGRSGMVSLGSVLPRAFAVDAGRDEDGGERNNPFDDGPVQVAGMAR